MPTGCPLVHLLLSEFCMADSSPLSPVPEPAGFSLILGGPLFQVMRRAHLADDALLLLRKRVVVISLLAWLPLFVLSSLPIGSRQRVAAGREFNASSGSSPNLRAALRWAIDDDRHLTDAEQLALGLNVFWWVTGGSREAVGWMRRILDRPGPVTADRVALTMDLSDQLQAVGDMAAAATACDAALDLARTPR